MLNLLADRDIDNKKKRLLIVEDEVIAAQDLKITLEKIGYNIVDLVYNANDAINSVEKFNPDLIIMDIELNGEKSGISAGIEIRKKHKIPIIYITAYSDNTTLEEAKKAEPYGYIIKPFVERDLRTTIEIALHKDHIEKINYHNERKYSIILKSIRDGVIVTQFDGIIEFMNSAAEDMIGLSNQNVKGMGIRKLLNLKDKKVLNLNTIMSKSSENSVYSDEFTFTKKGGKQYNIEYDAAQLYDDREKKNACVFVLRDVTDRKTAEIEVQNTMAMLRKSIDGTIRAMAMTVETRDPYTAGHQKRVANLARAIANKLELSQNEKDGIRMAGVIHDLGKISIPAEILSKPGRLSDIEFSLIKTHPQIGYDILKTIDFPWPVDLIVYQHHERIDGNGYPNGLKGDEILLEARIIAVADVVEAMASHRPYRASLGIDLALEEIDKNKGRLFDPEVVAACIEVIRKDKFIF